MDMWEIRIGKELSAKDGLFCSLFAVGFFFFCREVVNDAPYMVGARKESPKRHNNPPSFAQFCVKAFSVAFRIFAIAFTYAE